VHGNSQLLFVVPSDPDQAFALRATDGRSVPIADLPALVKSSVKITAEGLVRVERKSRARVPGGATAQIAVSAFDPVTQKTVWTRECAPRSRFAFVDDRQALAPAFVNGAGPCDENSDR